MAGKRQRLLRWLAIGVFLAGGLLAAHAVSIPAKAVLAQVLLERAWQLTLQDGDAHRPWPWAEHWPVGKLHFPTLGESHVILEGDTGNVLAFAPGRNHRSGTLGAFRTTVISAHRDTHFSNIGQLESGDRIRVEAENGSVTYRVTATRVVDARQSSIRARDRRELILVTCWPFDAVDAGGSERYVVVANAEADLAEAATQRPRAPKY